MFVKCVYVWGLLASWEKYLLENKYFSQLLRTIRFLNSKCGLSSFNRLATLVLNNFVFNYLLRVVWQHLHLHLLIIYHDIPYLALLVRTILLNLLAALTDNYFVALHLLQLQKIWLKNLFYRKMWLFTCWMLGFWSKCCRWCNIRWFFWKKAFPHSQTCDRMVHVPFGWRLLWSNKPCLAANPFSVEDKNLN